MRIAKLAILVAVGTTVSCGDRTPPVLGEVTLAQPSEHTPLAALLTFSTDEPGRVSLEIADGDRTWSVTPVDDYRTSHEVQVLGLRPDRSHDVTVRVSDDAAGDVVWYHRTDEAALLAIRLQNGNLLYNTSPGGVRGALTEIDLLGDVKHTWRSSSVSGEGLEDAILVDVDSIHHDVLELPSGDFAVFSSEVRTFENYATSDEDPDASRATQDVVGDIVVEFARDGTLVNQWHLLDLVDTPTGSATVR